MIEGAPKPVKMNEHLNPGVKPIFACVGTYEDFGKIIETIAHEEKSGDIEYIVYGQGVYRNENLISSGKKFYAFSPIDGKDKLSIKFFDCTGRIVSGVSKETGKNISFLSHQDPTRFLYEKKDQFVFDLKEKLVELKEKCVPGTIDAVLIGGKYVNNDAVGDLRENYLRSINLLSVETNNVLGFEPIVINGPKVSLGYDNCFYNNEKRRVYLLRPGIEHTIPDTDPPEIFKAINFRAKDFIPSSVENHKDDWKQ